MNGRDLIRPFIMIAAVAVQGCGGSGDTQVSSSGSPEADQRADLRVGSQDGRGQDARTLYERLGGEPTVTAIVDDLAARTIADPRVNFERKDVRSGMLSGRVKPWDPSPEHVEEFKRHMVEFITLAAGGPAEYTGRDMHTVHKGMKITNNEFDAMVGDLKTSMDRVGVKTREKRDLLAVIETTRKEIVEKP